MKLAINVDHVATVRNARGGPDPDPVAAALAAEKAGAAGIVCHLREDRRHIRDADVRRLREAVTTKLDLEMAATPEIVAIARRLRPELATLVPERRLELTTEGGLDLLRYAKKTRGVVDRLHERGIAVSLFIDPVKAQIDAARETGAEMIEIHTGEYADERNAARRAKLLSRVKGAAAYARSLGLGVNAGHGLDYGNIGPVAKLSDIGEVSIGHAVIAKALEVGMERAVREMVALIRRARG